MKKLRITSLLLVSSSLACGLIPKAKSDDPAPKGTFSANISGTHLGSPFTLAATGTTTLSGSLNHILLLNGGLGASAMEPSVEISGPRFVLGGSDGGVQAQVQIAPYWGFPMTAPNSGGTPIQFQFDDILLNPFRFHGTISGTFGSAGLPEQYVFADGEFTAYPDCTTFAMAGALDCGREGVFDKVPLPQTFLVQEPPSGWARCPPEVEAVFIDSSTAGPCYNGQKVCLSTAMVFDGDKMQVGAANPLPCEKLKPMNQNGPSYRCVAQVESVQASGCSWKVTGLARPEYSANTGMQDGLMITAAADTSCPLPSRFCGAYSVLVPAP